MYTIDGDTILTNLVNAPSLLGICLYHIPVHYVLPTDKHTIGHIFRFCILPGNPSLQSKPVWFSTYTVSDR